MTNHVFLSESALDIADIISKVENPGAGGLNVFIGTVRNQTQGKEVMALEFEAYEPMALKEMEKLIQEVGIKFSIIQAIIAHRTGRLKVGETAVVIAVSAAHREDAFAGCRFLIDELKKRVPIWKKEIFTDHSSWVSAYP